MKINLSRLESKLHTFSDIHALVIGDIMLDCFTYGDVHRVSPESPALILKKNEIMYMPGGAANVVSNVIALGARASLVGVIGEDKAKDILLEKLLSFGHVDTSGIFIDSTRLTTQKTRYISRDNHLLRVDEEVSKQVNSRIQRKMLDVIKTQMDSCDIIIFSDYAKGVFASTFVKTIIKWAKKKKKIMIADIKPSNKLLFKGVDIVKPNLLEAKQMTALNDIDQIGRKLRSYFKSDIVITKGPEGVSVFTKKGQTDIPAKKARINDVSGAGDTMVSVIALGVAAGLSLEEASYIANMAGGAVIQKPGTATVSLEELVSLLSLTKHVDDVGIVSKLWGYEKWLENNEKYCCKVLSIKKGYQCSLHYHKNKDEMFLILSGHIRLEADEKVKHMYEGNFFRVTPGIKHRFQGIVDSLLLEVSTHHEESDSYRIEASKKVE